ncbi:MAG: hypothetical protein K2N05_07840 [Muribaculaceae bacterium]|nr:hypothetical protein [Muribaculaceae bacterium]
MNNQIFQPTRFLYYFKKTINERRTSLLNVGLIFLLLPMAITLLLPYFNGYYLPGDFSPSQDPMWAKELKYYLFLWIACAFMCSDFFSPLQKKTDRTAMLTCPASNFEKFVAIFLIYAVAIPIIMTIFYFFADAVRVWVYSVSYPECNFIHYISPDYLLTFGCGEKYLGLDPETVANSRMVAWKETLQVTALFKYSLILIGGLFFQAIFTLGSAVWPKKSYAKTFGFLLGMGFVCGMLFYYGIKCFYGHDHAMMPRDFGIANDFVKIYIFDTVAVLFVIFTWWLSYLRFKEWEVVRRW